MPLTSHHIDQRTRADRNVLAWLTPSPPGLTVRELARMPGMRLGESAIRKSLARLVAARKVKRVASRRFQERVSGPSVVKCARFHLVTAAARVPGSVGSTDTNEGATNG